MNQKLDYKKVYKDLYQPKEKPMVVNVPPIQFFMVDGVGNPNQEGGEYQSALELLYALTYTIKMSKMSGKTPQGYFEYVVLPLEGLWWMIGDKNFEFVQLKEKDNYCWTSMIRQPEFVTYEIFDWAINELNHKKPQIDTSKARFEVFEEGKCVQMLHIGLYDDEPRTIKAIEQYMQENQLEDAIGDIMDDGKVKRHHEIYLGDPRKITPEKRKTILRHPVR